MRSSAISIYFLGEQICYARSDLVQWQYFTCSLKFRSRFGHPVYGAGRPILRNRMMPFFMQRAQPFSTISPHASQYNCDDVTTPKARDAFEKDVNRGTIRGVQRILSVRQTC